MSETTRANASGSGMVLTERDRRVIAAVARFGILTREQVARHLAFGSVTRANAVLLRLYRHRYLERRTQASLRGTRRQAYVLGPTGAALLEGSHASDTPSPPRAWRKRSDLFVEHELQLNDVRLAFEHAEGAAYRLLSWRTPAELREPAMGVIPDGFLEYAVGTLTFAAFVEADLGTESRTRWRGKVDAYCRLAFSGRFAQIFGRQFFRVLVVTTSETRAANVAGEIARQTDRVFRLTTFDALLRDGPLAPIWRRPTSREREPLTQSPAP